MMVVAKMIDEVTRSAIDAHLQGIVDCGESWGSYGEHGRAIRDIWLSLGYCIGVNHGSCNERAVVVWVTKHNGRDLIDAPGATTYIEAMRKAWRLIQLCETPGAVITREILRGFSVGGEELKA